jgi:hypothetical protein
MYPGDRGEYLAAGRHSHLKIATANRLFRPGAMGMEGTFQAVVAGEVATVGAGNLVQPFGVGGALGEHAPSLDDGESQQTPSREHAKYL